MNVKDKIKQIAYNEGLKTSITTATILSYDDLNNIAKIITNNGVILDNVPISIIPGVHMPSIQPNDSVYVVFANNSISNPKIIARSDELYAYNSRVKERHLRKGETYVNIKEEEGELKYPSSSKWIDSKNNKTTKYGDFYGSDAISNAVTG